ERDEKGNARAILSAKGEKTVLGLDAGGYLASMGDADGELARMDYSSDGLLRKLTRRADQKADAESPAVVQEKPKQGTWQVVDSGVKEDLHAVSFLSDKVGIAIGANRTVLRTADGGKTWRYAMERKERI